VYFFRSHRAAVLPPEQTGEDHND
jgi:hypothetical protein